MEIFCLKMGSEKNVKVKRLSELTVIRKDWKEKKIHPVIRVQLKTSIGAVSWRTEKNGETLFSFTPSTLVNTSNTIPTLLQISPKL